MGLELRAPVIFCASSRQRYLKLMTAIGGHFLLLLMGHQSLKLYNLQQKLYNMMVNEAQKNAFLSSNHKLTS